MLYVHWQYISFDFISNIEYVQHDHQSLNVGQFSGSLGISLKNMVFKTIFFSFLMYASYLILITT